MTPPLSAQDRVELGVAPMWHFHHRWTRWSEPETKPPVTVWETVLKRPAFQYRCCTRCNMTERRALA